MIDVRESTDKLKILIVDDSELNRELLAGMLGDEYEIYQVENGKLVKLIAPEGTIVEIRDKIEL